MNVLGGNVMLDDFRLDQGRQIGVFVLVVMIYQICAARFLTEGDVDSVFFCIFDNNAQVTL